MDVFYMAQSTVWQGREMGLFGNKYMEINLKLLPVEINIFVCLFVFKDIDYNLLVLFNFCCRYCGISNKIYFKLKSFYTLMIQYSLPLKTAILEITTTHQ